MSIYKTCDIRGRFGVDLQVEHASRLGIALFSMKGPGQVLVGGDGRISTQALKSALIDSLIHSGCQVIDLGQVPTPLFYYARDKLGIDLGVMVTASHNPPEDNGFKITLGSLPITPQEMAELARIMEDLPASIQQSSYTPYLLSPSPVNGSGGKTDDGKAGQVIRIDLFEDYQSYLAERTPDLTGMKVIVDCSNGMAGLIARQAWAKSKADVSFLLEEVDGSFPVHAPNPAEIKNLALLAEAVRERGADLGVAYDGDADRVAFIDEGGRPVANDKVIVLFARQALQDKPGTVVYDQKCSRVVPDIIKASGGEPVMELSGHTFIKRAFLTLGAVYAGELSGHHFLRLFNGDDGIGASLIFAKILKESAMPFSQLAAGVPAYPITPDIRLPVELASVPGILSSLEKHLVREARIVRTDGLRLEFSDGWGLVRPSVTEPAITLRFEAVDEAALQRILTLVEEASPLLKGRVCRLA